VTPEEALAILDELVDETVDEHGHHLAKYDEALAVLTGERVFGEDGVIEYRGVTYVVHPEE
jgi:hypothetical protein